jgi:hypothetical protein
VCVCVCVSIPVNVCVCVLTDINTLITLVLGHGDSNILPGEVVVAEARDQPLQHGEGVHRLEQDAAPHFRLCVYKRERGVRERGRGEREKERQRWREMWRWRERGCERERGGRGRGSEGERREGGYEGE